MRVIVQADGRCPSCGATGDIAERIWRGKPVTVLVPEPNSIPRPNACLYLRPYAITFRSAARLRAVAHAMHPFGNTVALLDHTDTPFPRAKVPTFTSGVTPAFNLVIAALDRLWELGRRRGVQMVGKVDDDDWQSTFRRLAIQSRLIIMDVSASGSGLTYEAEYISDLELADRLILIHAAGSTADDTIGRLHAHGVHPPVLLYNAWHLGDFANQIRHTAAVMLGATA
jgi:hypothetical protein